VKTESEQLLYYSIPGFFVFFFIFLFLILVGFANILDTQVIAFVIAAVIPIGFITYQGYIYTLYPHIWGEWGRTTNPFSDFFKRCISRDLESLDANLAGNVRESIPETHILIFNMHKGSNEETIDYSWRLVNLINARGVSIFACFLALFIPAVYGLCLYVSSQNFPVLASLAFPTLRQIIPFLTYYALIAVAVFILWSGISRIKQNLADFNTGMLISERSRLEQFVKAFSAFKTVSIVEELLSKEKKHTDVAQKLIDEAYQCLKDEEWEKALQNASEAYKSARKRN
jgi:hypothetical protein